MRIRTEIEESADQQFNQRQNRRRENPLEMQYICIQTAQSLYMYH